MAQGWSFVLNSKGNILPADNYANFQQLQLDLGPVSFLGCTCIASTGFIYWRAEIGLKSPCF